MIQRVINACRKLAALLHAFLSEGRAGQQERGDDPPSRPTLTIIVIIIN